MNPRSWSFAALVLGLGVVLSSPAGARPLAAPTGIEPGPAVPVDRFVGPDGRFDLDAARAAGVDGTLDLSGFVTKIDPTTGEPCFYREDGGANRTPGDENWWDGFYLPGADGGVLAMAVYGGSLVVGGVFSWIGPSACSHVAVWDGTAWTALGGGTDGYVSALIVHNGSLYAGGSFQVAGTVSASRVARWDGTSWSALGAGVANTVSVLAVYGDNLIAGGSFTQAGGSPANRIASWNGATWSALGAGTGGSVNALAVYGADLYAAGSFTTAGGGPANRIASWNGTAWSTLGSGTSGTVTALAVSGSDLVVGGGFLQAGGLTVNRIARWDGSAWHAIGTGMDGSVSVLLPDGSGLIAGGSFTIADGVQVNRLACWEGAAWSAFDGGMSSGTVYAAAQWNGHLFAGGNFRYAGEAIAQGLAQWDGTSWSATVAGGAGLMWGSGYPYCVAFAMFNGDLIAGGNFSSAGDVLVANIARWDGSTWYAMGQGLPTVQDGVRTLCVYDDALIAGGGFTISAGAPADYIARWDGDAWSTPGGGTDGGVWALTVYGEELIAGGGFTAAGGAPANCIARWNGNAWNALPGIAGSNGVSPGDVWSLAVHEGELFVGGNFSSAGGGTANLIAAWNGSGWHALGNGAATGTEVSTMTVYNGDLIVGGDIQGLGGVEVNGVARWDGATWYPLGDGTQNWVLALTTCGSDLIMGTNTWGNPTTVATWDGSVWSSLGDGVNNSVWALLGTPNGFYAGGEFSQAGGKPSSLIARWMEVTSDAGEPIGTVPSGNHLALRAQNPYPVGGAIRVTGEAASAASVRIFDARGRCVRILGAIERREGEAVFQWNGRTAAGRTVPASTYFVRAESGGNAAAERIVLVR